MKKSGILGSLVAALIAGCSGSDNASSPDLTGQFVDSPVSGLYYISSRSQGLTNENGEFVYAAGDQVSFYLGGVQGIFLGSATGDSILTPNDLAAGNSARNIARLLLSLDADGINRNGITLDDAALNAASSLRLSSEVFNVPADEFPGPQLQGYIQDQVTDKGRRLRSNRDAQVHLACSETDIQAQRDPDGICDDPFDVPPQDDDSSTGNPGDGGNNDSGGGNDNGGDGGNNGGGDGGDNGGGDNGNGNNGDGGDNDQPVSSIKSIYEAANACFHIRSGGHYISLNQSLDAYNASPNEGNAARFFMKPTDLGTYLLLSGYQRSEGETGTKQLLGLSDQFGELLDEAGNFVGEVGILAHGIGDMADFFIDPLAPNDDSVQSVGDGVQGAGDTIADNNVSPALAMVGRANDLAVWRLTDMENGRYAISSEITGQKLAVVDGALGLTSADAEHAGTQFVFTSIEGCDPYPEVSTGATLVNGAPARYLNEVELFQAENQAGQLDDDDVFGFVDTHAHISAFEFIGGRINYGDPFHKFGIDHALEDCEENHGPQGMTGFVEHVTTEPGPHDTRGWPDFPYWPVRNSLQHHQSYYKWIERVFLAGQKILVNHLVHNEILCQLNPQKERDCDAVPAILLQAELMHKMQDYIDAQLGGPGKGWFRIVDTPKAAREVIADGKMAVILGLEMSKPLNCGEFAGASNVPECTMPEIRERMDELEAFGVTSMFPVHKFDNAFGGHLPDLGNPVGIAGVLYLGNLSETGHFIEYETCPDEEYTGTEDPHGDNIYHESTMNPLGLIDQLLFQLDYLGQAFPDSPEGFDAFDPRRGTNDHCNARGLSDLGEQLIQEMMLRGWLIETDHISRKAATRILEITAADGYPLINSHGGWGGTEAIRDRLASQGGSSSSFARGDRNGWVDTLRRDGGRDRPAEFTVAGFGGTGFGTDVNGIASLPGQPGAEPEGGLYPYMSVDGRVQFDVQKTGDREFSLYAGRGVAHYGLFADLIADMQYVSERPEAEVTEALKQLFTSAEAYLRMWERAEAVAERLQAEAAAAQP